MKLGLKTNIILPRQPSHCQIWPAIPGRRQGQAGTLLALKHAIWQEKHNIWVTSQQNSQEAFKIIRPFLREIGTSQRGLEVLLRPKLITVIGALMKPNRVGYLMVRNLLAGGSNGPVLPVTPAWKATLGVLTWPGTTSLPFTPDLAVLCTDASRNLTLLEELGEKGCKACAVLSAPASQYEDPRACALHHNMHLLGPSNLGSLAPW